jgi:hypothetical protein
VQVDTPKYKRMVDGNRYLLFLSSSVNAYVTIGDSQGIFELRPDGTVSPHTNRSLAKLKGAPQNEFLEAVCLAAEGPAE